jgi:hypothetical protein
MLDEPGSGGTVELRRALRQQCDTNSLLGGLLQGCEIARSPNLRMNSIARRREQLGGLKSDHKQCKHSYRPRDNVSCYSGGPRRAQLFFFLSFCSALPRYTLFKLTGAAVMSSPSVSPDALAVYKPAR